MSHPSTASPFRDAVIALAERGFTLPDPTTDDEPDYGWHLVLDLHDCIRASLDHPGTLHEWVTTLVPRIGMVPYGQPIVASFGHRDPRASGYTVVQLIETSSITAHLSPLLRTAHIDVFSCRAFDPVVVVEHTRRFLGGAGGRAIFLPRG